MVGDKEYDIKYKLQLTELEFNSVLAALGSVQTRDLEGWCAENGANMLSQRDCEIFFHDLKDLSES